MEGGGRPGQGYPLAWYMVESEPAPHRCDGIWASLHSLSISLPPFFLFRPDPLSLFSIFYNPHSLVLPHRDTRTRNHSFPL